MQSTLSFASARSGTSVTSAMTNRSGDTSNINQNSNTEMDLNDAFHDLSTRSSIFRNKLIEEFQLLDNVAEASTVLSPCYTSRDILDEKLLKKMLEEGPNQLIKFTAFKRAHNVDNAPKVDRRLTRAKNINSLPIGAWAGWMVEHPYFQNFLMFLIILCSILVGVGAEFHDEESEHWEFFTFSKIVDQFALMTFAIEIGLRWLDNFAGFWADGWNILDFAITVLSAVPELLALFGPASQSGVIGSVASELRTLRVLRTLKMVIRFGSLKIIVMTIIEAFRSMAFIMLLLILVAYIFAIIAVNLFEPYTHSDRPGLIFQDYFNDIGNSFASLFILLTLDRWDVLNQDLILVTDPIATYVYIITWVWLGAFIFRNIFVGVMVNNFDKISTEMKEKQKEYVKAKKLQKMRRRLDKELLSAQGTLQMAQKKLANTAQMSRGPSVAAMKTAENRSITSMEAQSVTSVPATISVEAKEKDKDLAKQKLQAEDLLDRIQKLLSASTGVSKGWEKTVAETLQGLASRKEETMWPRDSLFKYFQSMENLQENMKEYQELQSLATWTLLELHDT